MSVDLDAIERRAERQAEHAEEVIELIAEVRRLQLENERLFAQYERHVGPECARGLHRFAATPDGSVRCERCGDRGAGGMHSAAATVSVKGRDVHVVPLDEALLASVETEQR